MRVMINLSKQHAQFQPAITDILRRYDSKVVVISNPASLTVAELRHRAVHFDVDKVIVFNSATRSNILKEMGKVKGKEAVTDDDWSGTVLNVQGTPVMFAGELRMWFHKPAARFIFEAHAKKFIPTPVSILTANTKYRHTIITKENSQSCLHVITNSVLVAIDIETLKHKYMSMVGYSCLSSSGIITTFIVNLVKHHMIQEYNYEFIRAANLTPPPKIFHNGTYDNQYFARYQFPVYNYVLDTEYLFHSLYAELPKSLAFVTAYYLPTSEYWKNMSNTDPAYCALDCYNTLMACVYLLQDISSGKSYAITNYQEKFPLTTPAIWSAMHGFNSDVAAKDAMRLKDDTERGELQSLLNTMAGGDVEINVNSPKQVPALFYRVLGARKIKIGRVIANGCPELVLKKLSEQHPLIRKFAELVQVIRKRRKAISTYYDCDLYPTPTNQANDIGDYRLLWSYRIDGTKSERLSCKQSNFGKDGKSSYGAQVQNVPLYFRASCIADVGYSLGSKDYSQSEARCVAYLSDDKALIGAFKDADSQEGGDFYNNCGELFFGIPRAMVPKTLRNKVIKKIIHGSNYCMKGQTFVDNAGTTNLTDGMKTLSVTNPLIEKMSVLKFGNYLLSLYHKAYPDVRAWYKKINIMLRTGGIYVSVLGYTHKHFDDPSSDNTLRFAVSLQPQNLSVHLINRSVVQLFWEVQVPSNGEFKYIAQVHDENVYQCKIGTEEKYQKIVGDIMAIPVEFPSGEVMIIPTDGGYGQSWDKIH